MKFVFKILNFVKINFYKTSLISCIFILSCVSAKVVKDSPSLSSENQAYILKIKQGEDVRSYTTLELLNSKYIQKIEIEKDPAYSMEKKSYMAIAMSDLFKDFSTDKFETLLFTCLDGFSAPISLESILNKKEGRGIAYLAIENPKAPWASLKKKQNHSAGPFYLVWISLKDNKIKTEEWPYQVISFELKSSFESQFPKTVPRGIKNHGLIAEGYKLFQTNCFACHSLNGEGEGKMGPDLNRPHSPTEYMNPKYLTQLIRNPQNVRHWSQSKMSGFSPEALSSLEISKIIKYLTFMAKNR